MELEEQIRRTHGEGALEVLAAMKLKALGTLYVAEESREGMNVYQPPPDPAAAKLYLERVLGPPRIAAVDVTAIGDPELEAIGCTALGITLEQLYRCRAEMLAARMTGPGGDA